jgi:hypothetical protein
MGGLGPTRFVGLGGDTAHGRSACLASDQLTPEIDHDCWRCETACGFSGGNIGRLLGSAGFAREGCYGHFQERFECDHFWGSEWEVQFS